MSDIRVELVYVAIHRVIALIDFNIYNNIHKQYEFKKQTILVDESLTENEKSEAIKILTRWYDEDKIRINEGTKRICEICNKECLATLFCEHCVRNYLKANFSNWTSGNDDIDNLIKECQVKAICPNKIPEWIPYNEFRNIEYLTEGGCSEIYTAEWINGSYDEWDSEEQQFKRFREQYVVLKRSENVENANQSWFEEAKSHLNISNKWGEIVQCYGLTKDPSNGSYMLVMDKKDIDLRKYLQQNHHQLTWKERIQIAANIILSLGRIHDENAIHRDLHSGNILFTSYFSISDLGFCGPADKPLKSIYGNLPYVAPEVIIGKEQTFKSDIYSIAMIMWEISSGQPPFINYEHNYDLAMNIVNGIRPKIVSGTPLEYKNLIMQCWDADPSKRPDINTLRKKINDLNYFYQSKSNESLIRSQENNSLEINSNIDSLKNYTNSTSKVYHFENLPEPRNATEEELEAFHSKSYNFYIPDNIDDFDKLNNQKNRTSRISSIFKVKSYLKYLKRIQKMANVQNSNYYREEIMQQQRKNIDIDEDEVHNNPNLHSEEQDELEIPDSKDLFYINAEILFDF
ncbi:Mkk2p [Rhizophagus irregularis DAOM 197198w]|uniref:Mkk2p n=1 Tax=Rhizophagus irregularis (strain DAOM 197198w) TaxID=1432141 RepID=A0A015LME8_RHIIW|nr:Mkk2p [Rhizophagus irregularis DAOM 197198w]